MVRLIIFILTALALVSSAECIYAGEGEEVQRTYIVQKGDNLYRVSKNFGVSLTSLMNANGLSGTVIYPGQVLVVPKDGENQSEYYLKNQRAVEFTSRGGFTRSDLMLLAKIIHAEARGECFEGQVAVGAVVLNRVQSPGFPKTLEEVIMQKCSKGYQFTPVSDGSINLEPDQSAVKAAESALAGEDPTGGALFFYNPSTASDQWIRTLPVITRIGNHVFATSS